MWIRTEEGALNLDDCRSLTVHSDREEESGAEVWIVCALTKTAEHVTIAVRSDHDEAVLLREQLVSQLVPASIPSPVAAPVRITGSIGSGCACHAGLEEHLRTQ